MADDEPVIEKEEEEEKEKAEPTVVVYAPPLRRLGTRWRRARG